MDSPNEASAELELATANHHLRRNTTDRSMRGGRFLPKLDDDRLVGPLMEATPGDVVPRPDILPEMVMMQKHMDQELSTLQLVQFRGNQPMSLPS